MEGNIAEFVDREARRKVMRLAMRFVGGRITNDEFDEGIFAVAHESEDEALFAIVRHCFWPLYDEFRTYFCIGPNEAKPEMRRFVALCILFLQSEQSYDWPDPSSRFCFHIQRFVERVTRGFVSFPAAHHDYGYEDFAFPFRNRAALTEATRCPHLLCGQSGR